MKGRDESELTHRYRCGGHCDEVHYPKQPRGGHLQEDEDDIDVPERQLALLLLDVNRIHCGRCQEHQPGHVEIHGRQEAGREIQVEHSPTQHLQVGVPAEYNSPEHFDIAAIPPMPAHEKKEPKDRTQSYFNERCFVG